MIIQLDMTSSSTDLGQRELVGVETPVVYLDQTTTTYTRSRVVVQSDRFE